MIRNRENKIKQEEEGKKKKKQEIPFSLNFGFPNMFYSFAE